MTGVIYARYSSDNQREESIEGQLRECTAFAQKNDIKIIEHYIDRAYSAKTDNRPEFQRMIRESARKSYDVVIVWKWECAHVQRKPALLFSSNFIRTNEFRFSYGSPNLTNPNYFVNRNWFGFVFYYNYSN